MEAAISVILKTLLSSIIEGITAYFEKEKAASMEWEAKAREQQLKSIKDNQIIEKEIKKNIEAAKNKKVSVSDWNAGLLLLLCFLPLLSGCYRFYVNAPSYHPVPPKIERPQIPEDVDGDGVKDEFTAREQIIIEYALQLEEGYNSVRNNAIKHNEEADLPVSE